MVCFTDGHSAAIVWNGGLWSFSLTHRSGVVCRCGLGQGWGEGGSLHGG